MEPDAFLLQTAKQVLYHADLLGCVRRDVLLLHSITDCDRYESLGPEDKPIIAAQADAMLPAPDATKPVL